MTALAKFVSAAGSARILQLNDSVLNMPFRVVFYAVGSLELIVAIYCFLDHNVKFRTSLVAWLSTTFVVYRLGLTWVGSQKYCPCLGNLTDAIHLSPDRSDLLMKIILAYLFFGSYASLLCLWLQKVIAARGTSVIAQGNSLTQSG
jgi:hypothetical protein